MKAFRILFFLAVLLLIISCEKQAGLDESMLQIWLSSDEVMNRDEPALFSSQRGDGSWVAIATGDFVEIEDGIDLNSNEVLTTEFYVFPGRKRVGTIEEAVEFCKNSAGRKYKAEQASGGNGGQRP